MGELFLPLSKETRRVERRPDREWRSFAYLRRWFRVRVPTDPIQQIAQRILWSIQSKYRQTSGARCFPISFWIVADVKDFVRFQVDQLQRAPINFRIRFVRAYLAGDENVRKKLRDSEMLENEPQTPIEI